MIGWLRKWLVPDNERRSLEFRNFAVQYHSENLRKAIWELYPKPSEARSRAIEMIDQAQLELMEIPRRGACGVEYHRDDCTCGELHS